MGKYEKRIEEVSIPGLSEILSNVNNLPPAGGEDLKESLERQTTSADELLKVVNRVIADHKGEGEFVWKKMTAQDGDFIDYVVSSDTEAFPDEAIHTDGYWYEIYKADPQTKVVTASTSPITVTPDEGYLIESVTVNPTPSQAKTATPSTSAQTISPDSGKLLSSVTVNPVPDSAKSGVHVWKKYKYSEIPTSSITITQVQGGGISSCIIKFSSSVIDFSKVDSKFFVGMQLKSTKMGTITLKAGNGAQIGPSTSENHSYTWTPSTQQMSFSFTGSSGDTWSVLSPSVIPQKVFEGYAVANSESTYPNSAVQNNYWYEKLPANLGDMTYGTINYSSSSSSVKKITISHGLRQVPQYFYLFERLLSMGMDGDISVVHYYLYNGDIQPFFLGGHDYGSTFTRYGKGVNGSKITATATEISITTPYDLYTRYGTTYYWLAIK